MADYEQWERGDPFNVVARREAVEQRKEEQCGSCVHKRIQDSSKREIVFKCVFQKKTYGKRCDLFCEGFYERQHYF